MDEPTLKPIFASHGVKLAILFGSRARGTARTDSDLDVAIDGPGEAVLPLAADLREATGHDVDVVVLDDPNFPLLQAIVREGRPLYEARRGAFAAFRARAWTTLETDRPAYHRMRDAWLAKLASEPR